MDPGNEYERMLAVWERARAAHAEAVARGDPSQALLAASMQRIWANVQRYHRLVMREAGFRGFQ